MNITPMQMYWLTKLDNIIGFFYRITHYFSSMDCGTWSPLDGSVFRFGFGYGVR